MSEPLAGDADLGAVLLALESALARRDASAVGRDLGDLLEPDFEEVGASGRRWDRASTLEALASGPGTDLAISAFDVARLSADVALVSFATTAGRDAPGRVVLRASIWVRHGGRWRIRFHQGTPTEDPAPEGGRGSP